MIGFVTSSDSICSFISGGRNVEALQLVGCPVPVCQPVTRFVFVRQKSGTTGGGASVHDDRSHQLDGRIHAVRLCSAACSGQRPFGHAGEIGFHSGLIQGLQRVLQLKSTKLNFDLSRNWHKWTMDTEMQISGSFSVHFVVQAHHSIAL